jgi:pyruvate kinase
VRSIKGMASKTMDPEIILSAIPLGKPELTPPKTRIICTLAPLNRRGSPADQTEQMDRKRMKERVKQLAKAGMSIARINFSHVTSKQERENVWNLIKTIRQLSEETKMPIGILMDLCGPRLRTGRINGNVKLKSGKTYILTAKEDLVGNDQGCSVDYEDFAKDIKKCMELHPNSKTYIYIDDGKLKLQALKANETNVACRVKIGGPLESHKGINVPGVELSTSALTRKDMDDIDWIFGREKESGGEFRAVDFIALSFVKKPDDIKGLKNYLKSRHNRTLPVVAKLETAEAVEEENMREILVQLRGANPQETGAIMIARGDLAIETSHEKVPELQTTLIDECNKLEVPVIVATQLLESMCDNQTPFRSEVVDIYSAVREGADMVMLSRETASGKYPLQATKTMASILRNAEQEKRKFTREPLNPRPLTEKLVSKKEGAEAIGGPACKMADTMESPAVVVCAATGTTAKKCAYLRPRYPIIAITRNGEVAINLLLYRGVYSVLIGYEPRDIDDLLRVIEAVLEKLRVGNEGDPIVSTFGTKPGVKPLDPNSELATNTMRLITILTRARKMRRKKIK